MRQGTAPPKERETPVNSYRLLEVTVGTVTRLKLTPDIKTAFDSPGTSSRSVPSPQPSESSHKQGETPPRPPSETTDDPDRPTQNGP